MAYYDNWGGFGDLGESLGYHIPIKWISEDGKTFWVVFSSESYLDRFNIVKATLVKNSLNVNVMNNFFDPDNFNVQVGDFVKWTLMEGSHTTTSNSVPPGAASWDYTFTGLGDSFVYEVLVPGNYSYESLLHPGMNGSFTAVENTFQISVSINDGWNLVSIPGLQPDNQNVTTWWSGKDPNANVFKYNGGYQSITKATPAEGYWLKNLGSQTYNTGDEWPAGGLNIVTHDPIKVNSGWNLIGGYEYHEQTGDITTNPPGLLEGSIFGYSDGYQVANEIVPGYGYWVKLSGAGQIILSPPTFSSISRITKKINEDWGEIIITDNSGRSFRLYTVKGKTDLNHYDLPPLPPPGMFDVRYESGKFAEDISNSIKAIEMSGVDYPIKIKVENNEIRLRDESGKRLNIILKSGEEITISNNLITKLFVSSNVIPDKYSLEQNYPNPFNPETAIEFGIPEDANNVTLTIYNALGEKVTTLINGSLKPGYYHYQWNAKNYSSGLYIYQLMTEKFVSVKKMILLK